MYLPLLIIHFFLKLINGDPCQPANYEDIPFSSSRYFSTIYDSSVPAIDDIALPSAWYRAGVENIPNEIPPSAGRCGTQFPIYMLGNYPNAAEGEVQRDVCIFLSPGNKCVELLTITVKTCNGYRVYKLGPSGYTDTAYCFGKGDEVAQPTESLSNVRIEVDLDQSNEKLEACCRLSELTDHEEHGQFLYEATWFFGDSLVGVSETVQGSDIGKLCIILDENAVPSFKVGSTISCGGRVKFAPKGPPGPTTKSAPKFVGIEVLTPSVSFTDGFSGTVSLRQTVPFAYNFCLDNSNCGNKVVLDEHGCDGMATTGAEACGFTFPHTEWDSIQNLTITSMSQKVSGYSITKNIYLKTRQQLFHRIWNGYTLPPIKVIVHPSTVEIKGRACIATNDPHMVTFDKLPYDIQYEGTFLLYGRVDYGNLQVQMRTRSCSGSGSGFPYCVCGAAIQAGGDVYVLDRCDNKYGMMNDFKRCHDNILVVRELNGKYESYLPTGTKVEIHESGSNIRIYIYPSNREFGKTKGLCGNYNDNCKDDLMKEDGTVFPYTKPCKNYSGDQIFFTDYNFKPDVFSKNWSLSDNDTENLFALENEVLELWSHRRYLCRCTDSVDWNLADCTASEFTECNRPGNPVNQLEYCRVFQSSREGRKSHLRQKRDVDHLKEIRNVQIFSETVSLTPEEATTYCENEFTKSASYNLCEDVPNVDSSDAIAKCVIDIMISNSTMWMSSSREGLKSACLNELQLNTTLQEEASDGGESIAEMIRKVACTNECSGKGSCVNGTCLCDKGYGSPDCSVDLSVPPFFDFLFNDGLCDKQELTCQNAYAFGDDFVKEGFPSCMLQPFEITENGTEIISNLTRIIPAEVHTRMSVICPIMELMTYTGNNDSDTNNASNAINDTSFVSGHLVALSNDGEHFSRARRFYTYDSACQSLITEGGVTKFELKAGYCFISRTCFEEKAVRTGNLCLHCDPATSTSEWTDKLTTECGFTSSKLDGNQEPSKQNLWIIGAVLGAVALVAILSVVTWKLKSRINKSKRVSDSQVYLRGTEDFHRATTASLH